VSPSEVRGGPGWGVASRRPARPLMELGSVSERIGGLVARYWFRAPSLALGLVTRPLRFFQKPALQIR